MRNSWKQVTRRTVSLLLSLVLALTLVTPAAFATEVGTPDGQTVETPQEQTGMETPDNSEVSEKSEQEPVEKPVEDPAEEQDPVKEPEDPVEELVQPEGDPMPLAAANTEVWDGTTATTFAGGSGTKDDPYQISNGSELAFLAQQVNAGTAYAGSYFKLTADIKLNSEDVPTGGNTWEPIGNSSSNKFSGTFDGNGHMVSGLYIEKTVTITSPFKSYMGLFGNNTGTIKNLIVKGSVSVVNTKNALTRVAGIVGENNNSKEVGTVQNCGFYGTVTAKVTKNNVVSDSTSSNGGVVGSGSALNCWYCYAGEVPGDYKLGVSGNKPPNSYHNVSETVKNKGTYAGDLNTEGVVNGAEGLNTDNDAAGKKWAVDPKGGALYPKLIDPPKTITMQPVFPDCTVKISANGTALTEANGYTYEVTDDTVTITVSGNGDDTIYYADSESKTSYTAEVENANLTAIGDDGKTFDKNDLPKTYYYGTLADFEALAAWNAAFNANTKIATIKDTNGLKAVSRMVNSGKDSMTGKTITLGANIDLKDTNWTPIGKTDNRFKGTFTAKWENSEDWTTNFYTISNLPDDLFGVVDGGTLQYVTINSGTGRLVSELKSGTVQYCMSTAESALVGTNKGTVSSCYYYNENHKENHVVESNSGTVEKCFYLADESTFGSTNDTGARTEKEFNVGRVTYELGNSWKCGANDKMPHLDGEYSANEVSLRKGACPEGSTAVVTLTSDGVLSAADGTQYFYGKASETVNGTIFDLSNGDTVVFEPAASYNDNCDFTLRVQSSRSVRYTYTLLKANIKWYTDNQSTKTYAFTSADELVGLALLTNGKIHAAESFSGWTLTLANDIDLRGITWTPIGDTNINRFAGVFDGCGKTIKGLSVESANLQYAGLFGNITGTVKNLQVDGSMHVERSEAGMFYVGGIVGSSTGTVQNCLNKVDVTAENKGSGNTSVGGVVGSNSGTVASCQNEGDVEGTGGNSVGSDVGGIVGSNSGSSAVANCANFGAVKGSGTAGGIAGSGSVANCYNLGDVTGGANTTYGISKGTVTNSYYICKLNGTETAEYVNSSDKKAITSSTDEAGNKVYKVGSDKLVDVLNKGCAGGTPWFARPSTGYPEFVLLWNGEVDPDAAGYVVLTVTYDANGGVGSYTDQLLAEKVGEQVTPVSYTIRNIDETGILNENGKIKSPEWNTQKDGKGTNYEADKSINVSENITLYAQWDAIWDGKGTADDPYQISDDTDLTALQAQVNKNGFSYTGKWFNLTNDIDLNNANWTPIGTASTTFAGNIEGGNHAISGLFVNSDGDAGLFRSLNHANTSTYIGNLTIIGTVTSTGKNAGGLVGALGSGTIKLENITTNVEVTSNRNSGSAGGLVGMAGASHNGSKYYITIINCRNNGAVSGVTAGGIVGGTNNYASNEKDQFNLSDCINNSVVTGTLYAGGILGGSNGSKATNCVNNGRVSVTQSKGQAGGISASGLHLAKNCVNTASVEGTFAAGIAYNLPYATSAATGCCNGGAVTGTNIAAGIVVYSTSQTMHDGGVSFSGNTGVINAPKKFGIANGGIIKNCFTYNKDNHLAISENGKTVSNSYYLASSKDEFPSTMGGEWASADDFASGKVAWGVDGGTDKHADYWTQGSSGYPIPIVKGETSTSYYRAQAVVAGGTGGTVTIKRGDGRTGDNDNAVYGPKDTTVTVTATPKDNTFALKSLTLDLMSTGSTSDLRNGGSFTLGAANAKVTATFASAGSGAGSGSGSGSGSGTGTGDENDEGLQDGLNMDVEYNVKGLVLSAYTEWGSNGGGKTFSQWLKDSPNVLRALIANSLDNMAAAAAAKKTDEASALAQTLLASLNEHSGVTGKDGDAIGKALQRFMTSGTEATFSTWLTTGSGMASGTVESILTQYTDSLLALADRLYTKWEASGTSMTFPVWLDAQQVSMANLSETAEEPDTDTTNDPQTTEAPEDVPDGQESEGQASGNSIWEIIGTAVRENPLIVWSIVAVIAAIVIVGAVRRYHKVKRDERDDNSAE